MSQQTYAECELCTFCDAHFSYIMHGGFKHHCYYAQIQWGKKPQNDSRVNHKNEMNEQKFHTRIAN